MHARPARPLWRESFCARSEAASLAWRAAFVATHLERDLPQLGIRVPAANLRRFWMMLAHAHAQLWNASQIGASLGLTVPTMRHYLDILSATFMVRELPPFHANLKKRLVKTPKVYRAADLFCFPLVEQSEAFGRVQLEAMASGIPIVCSDLRIGVNFVTRHGATGFAVPPRDPEALAAALNALPADPIRRTKMVAVGAARVEAEFSAERMVEFHLQLYRRLLGV